MDLINIHTHHRRTEEGLLEMGSWYFGQTIPAEAGWRSVGLHPWYLDFSDKNAARDWLMEWGASKQTLAIGEAGLDKVCETPWEQQMEAFEICVRASEQLKKPLVIHCVKAYSEIIDCKKRWSPRQPWIIHGFDKHPDTARMLLIAGCYLSFGAALLRPGSHAPEALRHVPADRFFLETDSSELTISEVYARAAEVLKISLEELKVLVADNFGRVFS